MFSVFRVDADFNSQTPVKTSLPSGQISVNPDGDFWEIIADHRHRGRV
jgi:hypothetical protein